MIKYIYNGETYNSFYELKRVTKNLVFAQDTPVDLLAQLGITVVEEPDPVVEPDPKQRRREEVATIEVTVDGMTFDGNEVAQRRMTGALVGWDDSVETIQWVLADNSVANVTKLQLWKALQAATAEMQKLWVVPYVG